MPRYHIHMSHISRPIPTYSIHNIQKYMIDYNHNLFTVPFYTKKVYIFWLCSYIIQDKTKQNKVVSDSHPICGSTACTGAIPERGISRRGEQSPVVIIFYKGYSPPKCSCSNQTHTHSSKNMHILTRMPTCHG